MPSPPSGKKALAISALAVSLIWLTGLLVPAHVPVDPPLWAPFPGAGGWSRIGDPAAASFERGVTLRSSVSGTNHLSFDLPLDRPRGERVRLQLSGRLIEERRIGKSWATASLDVEFVRASGGRFGHRTLRLVPRQAGRPERFDEVVDWPRDAAEVRVSLHSRAGAPTFSLVEGSAEVVRPNPLYTAAVAVLAGVALFWLVTLVRFARARDASASLFAPGAAALAIAVGVTLSMRVVRPLLTPVLVFAEETLGIDRDIASTLILKGGHALGFFLLTLGLLALRRRLGLARGHLVAFAALLAIGSEGVQAHLSDRGASLADVVIDLGGVLAAFVLAGLVRGRRRPDARRRRTRRGSGRRRRSSSSRTERMPRPDTAAPPETVDTDAVAGDAIVADAPGEGRRRRRRRSRRSRSSP